MFVRSRRTLTSSLAICGFRLRDYRPPGNKKPRDISLRPSPNTHSSVAAVPSHVASTGAKKATSESTRPKRQEDKFPTFRFVMVALGGVMFGMNISKIRTFVEKVRGPPIPRRRSAESIEDVVNLLPHILEDGATVSTDPEDLRIHGFSEDGRPPVLPSAVVYPISTLDVNRIVVVATHYGIPIRTNMGGQYHAPPKGSICIDMKKMDKIIEIYEADSDLICQPGVKCTDINQMLKEKGIPLYFPIDASPEATIGDILYSDCSDKEWALNATIVLPSNDEITTGRRAGRSAAGFDLTKLFISAKGTLGIVTAVTIKLAPILPTTVAVVQFPDVQKATEAATEALKTGAGIQCVTFVDDVAMGALNKNGTAKRIYPAADSLFFKFQGPTTRSLQESANIVKGVVTKHGGSNFQLARTEEEAEELWSDRENGHTAGLALTPGAKAWPMNVCVPISNFPQLVYETKKDIAEAGLSSTIVGNVRDGNFRALILFQTEEEKEKARELENRMVKRVIALDGTCKGERVGLDTEDVKRIFEELGASVPVMMRIKRSIDPMGSFNFGKLFFDCV